MRRNNYIDIFRGARSFARILGRERAFLGMLTAAFDESGKLADSSCVAFAGFLAEVSDAEAMSNKWILLLPREIEYIRMSEVLGFRGEFDGWKKDRSAERDQLLKTLVTMAHAHSAFFVATPMSCEDFRSRPEAQRSRLKNPQYCGFEGCVKLLAGHAARLGEKLQLYFDSSEEYSETCIRLYHKLRMKDQLIRDTCVSITFAEDQHNPSLQLADVYASCVRQDAMRAITRPDPLVDELLEIFTSNGGTGGSVIYKAGEGLGQATVEA